MAQRKSMIEKLVKEFSAKMLEKLNTKRLDGWTGWNDRTMRGEFVTRLLEHARRADLGVKGQWVDVANFAAFLDRIETRERKP